jgi:ribonucleoside-diphosphate reductase alpha chain
MSAGSRRGAMMATMRCDHPDILEFIEAKRDPGRLRHFNMSVLCTDEFMDAVKSGGTLDLVFNGEVYKTIDARVLWDNIMMNTYSHAEPGVIFIDRINAWNNLNYCETIAATNPCGEQPLPPYGACLLGSVNLCALLNDDWTLDAAELRRVVRIAVRMMDNVIDVSEFPSPAQRHEAKTKRRIGLGITGLGSALALQGVPYGSSVAQDWEHSVMYMIAEEAYMTSTELAKEKGAFPALDTQKYLGTSNMSSMPSRVRKAVQEHGIRNALLTSIAPTGTISLYAGNVSSGIEPIFAFEYERKVLQKDGSHRIELVQDYAARKWRERYPGEPFPESFVSAQTLTPKEHVDMQAVAQRWIDSSISKTINVPEDISFEDFKEVYMYAYDTGCKGCTTYRPNDVTGSVLSVTAESVPEEGGACELRYDENTGQLIRSCE